MEVLKRAELVWEHKPSDYVHIVDIQGKRGLLKKSQEVFYKDRKKPISVTLYAWDANGEKKLSTLQVSTTWVSEGPHSFSALFGAGVLLLVCFPGFLVMHPLDGS